MRRVNTSRSNNLQMYEDHAEEWWQPFGSSRFRSLQCISEFRLQLLESWIPDLSRKTVIDLGCGGGLLSAPLSKQGAKLTGMDRSPASVREARKHSADTASFLCADIRSVPLADGCADVVLLADVLDHIPNYELVLSETRRLLRPQGLVFVNTINRNFLSRALAIGLGENIGLVPKGTHDYRLLIRPDELESTAARYDLKVLRWQGERPALKKTIRKWAIHFAPCESLVIAYSALLQRTK